MLIDREREAMGESVYPRLADTEDRCCGCTACASICPVQAIHMEPEEKGFLIPRIDTKKGSITKSVG